MPMGPVFGDLRKTSWAAIIVLSGCLAIFSCYISGNLHPRFDHHLETVYNQFAVLKGLPFHVDGQEKDLTQFSQFRSRVLFPFLLKAVTEMHLMSDSQSFILLRIVTAFTAYLTFILVCTQVEGMSVKTAGAGAGALAYAMVFTFNHGWEHTTDFLDVMFFSGFLALALRRHRAALALVVLLATLNHQIAAFAGVIWFCLWGLEEARFMLKWREVLFSSALIIGSYTLQTAMKFWFGGTGQSIGYGVDGWLTIRLFIDVFRHPQPYAWPILLVAMVLPVSLWLWSNRAVVRGDVRRLVWASLLIVILGAPMVNWSELRGPFLGPMVIATFAAAVTESRVQRQLEIPS